MEIGVVGCGVAGLAAATFLADAGHKVTIFERFAEPRPLGAGLLLQPTGLAVLRALGPGDDALTLGARIAGLESRTRGGRVVLDLAYADLHPAAHGLGIHRGTLFELLFGRLKRSAAALVTDTVVVDVEHVGARASVVAKDSRRYGPFDLVVIADGAHSALRPHLMPHAKASLYSWGCIWTTIPDRVFPATRSLLRQRLHGTTAMMGLLPTGQGRTTMFWSLPVAEMTADRAVDLEAWRRAAQNLWPEEAESIAAAVAANDFTHATYRHVALPRWNDGPILFIGDAAHGTSPQLGQGANLSLLDAYELSRALDDGAGLAAALGRFSRRRTSSVRFYRETSRLLTPFFQSHLWPLGLLRDVFMGAGCYLPVVRPFMTSVLAGTRRSWLSTVTLDDEGNYRLDD